MALLSHNENCRQDEIYYPSGSCDSYSMGLTKMQPDQAQLASCVIETFKNSKLHK